MYILFGAPVPRHTMSKKLPLLKPMVTRYHDATSVVACVALNVLCTVFLCSESDEKPKQIFALCNPGTGKGCFETHQKKFNKKSSILEV